MGFPRTHAAGALALAAAKNGGSDAAAAADATTAVGRRGSAPASASTSRPCCSGGRGNAGSGLGGSGRELAGGKSSKAAAGRGGGGATAAASATAAPSGWRRLGGRRGGAAPPPPPPSSSTNTPSASYLALHRPIALVALIPTPAVLFAAGAAAGAIGKTLTAPLDRVKLLLQTRGGLSTGALADAARAGGVGKAFLEIGRQEGIAGYWRGNVPQILKVLPYSATQLCAYEALKRAFADETGSLSLPARLAAGASAGMAATLVTHPLDTLRLRMAVDPSAPTLAAAARVVLASGGPRALYRGLGASLVGIAPYMAIELAAFDVLGAAEAAKKKEREAAGAAGGGAAQAAAKPKPGLSFSPSSFLVHGFGRGATAALIATACCYPLDTARRRVQLAAGSAAAASGEGLVALVRRVATEEGPGALYRGFWPNAAKNLPNKGVKLGTFDAAKKLLGRAQAALAEERAKMGGGKAQRPVAAILG